MFLNLISATFRLERGTAAMIACGGDWPERFETKQIVDNRIDAGDVAPGYYLLLMVEITARRIQDQREAVVCFLGAVMQFTSEDAERGEFDLALKTERLFRVTIVDGEGHPVPRARLNFVDEELMWELAAVSPDRASVDAGLSAEADDEGALFFLRRPNIMSADRGEARLALC